MTFLTLLSKRSELVQTMLKVREQNSGLSSEGTFRVVLGKCINFWQYSFLPWENEGIKVDNLPDRVICLKQHGSM